jgi:hypothetical protein
VGENNHGLLSSVSSTTNRFGVVGRAVQFGGSNSFVTIPENDAFDSQDYAVSLWFRAMPNLLEPLFSLSKGRNNFELHLGSGLSGPTGFAFCHVRSAYQSRFGTVLLTHTKPIDGIILLPFISLQPKEFGCFSTGTH